METIPNIKLLVRSGLATGKYRKAYDAGYKARKDGVSPFDNPNLYGSNVSMSAWWEAGWFCADAEEVNVV